MHLLVRCCTNLHSHLAESECYFFPTALTAQGVLKLLGLCQSYGGKWYLSVLFKNTYLFSAAPGLCCCVGFPLAAASRVCSLIVHRLLTAVASLVAEHGLSVHGLQWSWPVNLLPPWLVASFWPWGQTCVPLHW